MKSFNKVEEILNREGELEQKIERIDDDSKSILEKDGVGSEMLEKIKEFFSQIPEFLNIGKKKKE